MLLLTFETSIYACGFYLLHFQELKSVKIHLHVLQVKFTLFIRHRKIPSEKLDKPYRPVCIFYRVLKFCRMRVHEVFELQKFGEMKILITA